MRSDARDGKMSSPRGSSGRSRYARRMRGDFVHLHVHSEYSMLDSSLRLRQMTQRAAELGMPALALTDHNNMFGTLQFVKACEDAGIKAIVGCELNVRLETQGPARHLLLLAAAQEGYRNLVHLVSQAWIRGSESKSTPSVDLEMVAAHHQGLVGLSACMGGSLAQEVLVQGEDAGRKMLDRLRSTFAEGHFFIELQDQGFAEQKALNAALVALAGEFGLLQARRVTLGAQDSGEEGAG